MHRRSSGSVVACVIALAVAGGCSDGGESGEDTDVEQTDDDEPADDGDAPDDDAPADDGDAPDAGEGFAVDDELDAVLADVDPDGPGCVVGVSHPDGRTIAARGLADIDTGTPLDGETIFDIGSVSKQFTAGAIALLVLDGELALDDDAAVLAGLEPFAWPVTVEHLVHMTSGVPDYVELLDADDDEVTTMDDALAAIGSDDARQTFEPGTAFEYSNSNYVLLSEIVHEVSGQPLPAFTEERIFEPLGLERSVVRDDQGDLLPGQARGYAEDGADWRPVGSSWRQTGDGAVHTTVTDLLTWLERFSREGAPLDGDVIGSAAWVDLMLQPGPVRDGASDYAFGIGIEDDGVLAHEGSWIGYSAASVVVPGEGLAAAVACNIDGVDADAVARDALGLWTDDR